LWKETQRVEHGGVLSIDLLREIRRDAASDD
jgi:hypothetical protein